MMEETHINLLKTAAEEIKSLRHQNQLHRARLDMFDSMMSVFRAEAPRVTMGCGYPDVVHEIEGYLRQTE